MSLVVSYTEEGSVTDQYKQTSSRSASTICVEVVNCSLLGLLVCEGNNTLQWRSNFTNQRLANTPSSYDFLLTTI